MRHEQEHTTSAIDITQHHQLRDHAKMAAVITYSLGPVVLFSLYIFDNKGEKCK